MSYVVEIMPKAVEDLHDIYRYIAFVLMDWESAKRQILNLEAAIRGLDEMPLRFRVYERHPWSERGLRKMPVDNFIVFYMVQNNQGIVSILRVLYGGRDMERELKHGQ